MGTKLKRNRNIKYLVSIDVYLKQLMHCVGVWVIVGVKVLDFYSDSIVERGIFTRLIHPGYWYSVGFNIIVCNSSTVHRPLCAELAELNWHAA